MISVNTPLSPSKRGNLYSDVLRSLHEVRQAATASTAKMREKLGIVCVRPGSSVAQATSLKADDLRDIQEENAGLNKMVGIHPSCNYCHSTLVWSRDISMTVI